MDDRESMYIKFLIIYPSNYLPPPLENIPHDAGCKLGENLHACAGPTIFWAHWTNHCHSVPHIRSVLALLQHGHNGADRQPDKSICESSNTVGIRDREFYTGLPHTCIIVHSNGRKVYCGMFLPSSDLWEADAGSRARPGEGRGCIRHHHIQDRGPCQQVCYESSVLEIINLANHEHCIVPNYSSK